MVRKSLGLLLVFPLLAASAGAAAAMSAAPSGKATGCRVIGAAKLPAGAVGGDALCRAVENAVAVRSPGLRYSAEIKVISTSRLSATLTVNGRALPDQNFAVSDRDLNSVMIERFAQSIADELAKASGR